MAKLIITSALRIFTENETDFDFNVPTVVGVLKELVQKFPDLEKQIFADAGLIRNFINIYVNDTNINQLYGLATDVASSDKILIIPSIAGGIRDDLDLDSLPDLTDAEVTRYSRHLILPEISIEGQQRLKHSRVLIVGLGALGSPAALYLAAAGIGTLGLIDNDFVEESNLQRQVLYGARDKDRPKVVCAAERIKYINPNVKVITFNDKLTSHNALGIVKDYDLVIDGSDNFPTRYLINDTCVFLGKPHVFGAIFRTEGQASVFYAKKGPCYRCLNPQPRPPGLVPACAEGGILNTLGAVIGSIQATDAIKLIVGGTESLTGRLLIYDAWRMRFDTLAVEKNYDCPVCGTHPTITELIDYEIFCGLKEEEGDAVDEISATELKLLFDEDVNIQIIDVRQAHEIALGKLPKTKAIPFGQVIRRQDDLDSSVTTIVVCKVGYLSAKTIRDLKAAGYTGELLGLKGGITAWANEVDSSIRIH